MKKLITRYKEIILYIFFGILTTAVNYGSYVLFAHCTGYSVAVSNGIAWILSVLFAFLTNKLLVFESKSLQPAIVLRELISFIACRLFSGFLDMGIMIIFTQVFHFNDLLVKLASNVLVVIINYALSKIFIFSKKESAQHS